MAFSTSPEYDIDLTCYEAFFDSSPSKAESESVKHLYSEPDLYSLDLLETNETGIGCCSKVPDIDCMWPHRDDAIHDVLKLYDTLRGKLFSEFDSEDVTTCYSYGTESPEVLTSDGLQRVPTLLANSSGNTTKNRKFTAYVQPRSAVEMADERSTVITSPACSTVSNSQDSDARVPSSCVNEFLPSGWYYIEE